MKTVGADIARDAAIEAALADCLRPLVGDAESDVAEDEETFLTAYATAGWRYRKLHLAMAGEPAAGLVAHGIVGVEAWSVADMVRVLMLRRRLAGLSDPARLVERIFRNGDNAEREVLLKGLMALPQPERFLATALDACRAAVLTTFIAIACDNAYPACHFPDHGFRAMVVKALHLGLPLARIHGLAERRDAELARMGEDYASERRHAGRAVAADLLLITQSAEELDR